MKFLVAVLLVVCICSTKGHPIEEMNDLDLDASRSKSLERFNFHITENGTKFEQKIYIDRKKQLELFKSPAHNGNPDSEYMFDFEMNMTVSRIKENRVCHISPLPSDLPRPKSLAKGLNALSGSSKHNIQKVVNQWSVGPKVDKSKLRKEIRDFCGKFPVYRLEPFSLDSVSIGKTGRSKRATKKFILCNPGTPIGCNPNDWKLTCKVLQRAGTCVYYIYGCSLNKLTKQFDCRKKHQYDSIVCCDAAC
ncbi:uncharacterized protein LOC110248314 [Exaiptasia diaphana]|uniref:BRICHOS domain-containing protein n=1 Tax=Exaiptasia diaphana TaxID=2652724 RepID=A0A913XVH4_EXADI|nr:uncharacterized protein LOC110248314 [Exaiptasia diaphana]KXJ08733.1 hypothetical protein AC249_AIPGENE20871 [Exaiptasia diaphana]